MTIAYKIVEDLADQITVRDLSGDLPYAISITNGAEELVRQLIQYGHLVAGKRLFYFDTDNRLDEILHDGQQFKGFNLL